MGVTDSDIGMLTVEYERWNKSVSDLREEALHFEKFLLIREEFLRIGVTCVLRLKQSHL